jgi:hypothetical protein
MVSISPVEIRGGRIIRPRFKLAGESHLKFGGRGPSTRAEARQDILVFLGHLERVL